MSKSSDQGKGCKSNWTWGHGKENEKGDGPQC